LRTEIPAFATVMTDEALGVALLDTARGEGLRAEIANVSSKCRVAVDHFFEQHPEFAAALEG
jgi:hypothetical protein